MASANVEGMLREGVNAMKAGRRDEARALLLRAVELDQYNEEAWLWLSGVLDSQEDQRTALENVLSINPGNDRARQGLDYINQQLGISSSSPPPMPSSLPPETGGLSTSVEWGAPSSTPEPVGRFPAPSPEPTPDVLDDWVNNLGLQSSGGAAIEDLRQTLGNNSPFGDVEVDMEDDIFSAGPFRADEPPAAKPTGKQTTKPVPEPVEPALTPEQRAERTAQRRAKRDERRTTQDPAPNARQAPAVDVMFPGIPAEIKPTRLPGTVEQAPFITTLLIALLVIANLAVAVYFMVGFFCANPIHCPWV